MSDYPLGTDREHAEHRRKEAMTEEWEATGALLRSGQGVFEALVAFQADCDAIHKSGKNKEFNYTFASLEDWSKALRPLFAKHGLAVAVSFGKPDEVYQGTTRNGGVMRYVRIGATAKLFHRDGSYLEFCAWGEGGDTQDKAVYKAMTGARKYLLAAISGAATTDDPEHEDVQPVRGEQRPQSQVEMAGRSSGARNAPRTGAGATPIATEDGIPLTKEMLELPWLDEPLGFGKHKDATWRTFCGGGMGSGRISYLGWFLEQEHKSDRQRATAEKARTVCRLVEEREMEQARKAQDQADDPAWEK